MLSVNLEEPKSIKYEINPIVLNKETDENIPIINKVNVETDHNVPFQNGKQQVSLRKTAQTRKEKTKLNSN